MGIIGDNMKCDVCGSDENVQCEVLLKGDMIDRIYHLCGYHWIEVYRRTLDDFMEESEYKCNTYVKMSADKLIAEGVSGKKIEDYKNDEGIIDVDELNPVEIRRVRPYSEAEGDL